MKKLAIFSSGAGTNAENIYNFFANGNRVKIELVIYDRRDAAVAERMRARDVDTLYLPAEVWTERPDEIVELLMQRGIDVVVLAGFMRHVPEQVTRAFTGRMLNIHPSLLPAYSGKGMYGRKVHEAVIAAGEAKSGATVHFVTDDLDAGEILMQEEVSVTPADTPESLEEKVHQAEYSLYPRAIMALLARLDQQAAANRQAERQHEEAAEVKEIVEEKRVAVDEQRIAVDEAAVYRAERPAAAGPRLEKDSDSQPEKQSPGQEWADTLGVPYDPTKLPPRYPGAVPPPVRTNPAPQNQPANPQPNGYNEAARAVYGDDVPPMPKSYLVWAVVMTVVCCMAAGVVAIVFASQVSSKYYSGDIKGAEKASERAQIWIIVSFVLGILSNTLYLPIALMFN